eukprot:764898-Hanusia_phi.AAC.12
MSAGCLKSFSNSRSDGIAPLLLLPTCCQQILHFACQASLEISWYILLNHVKYGSNERCNIYGFSCHPTPTPALSYHPPYPSPLFYGHHPAPLLYSTHPTFAI